MALEQHVSELILASRKKLLESAPINPSADPIDAAEGGCGVVGLAANFPVQGRHLVPAATQMHNRGNGKGGGIAASGLIPEELGVSKETLQTATLLLIAYLDPSSRDTVEKQIIEENYEVIKADLVPTVEDYRQIPGLEIRPPDVWRYFVRAKKEKLAAFAEENNLGEFAPRILEDEFVYQTSFELNNRFYASLGEKQAFVLSHGRDLMVFKIVGYAEQAAAYYRLNDLHAHIWIAHQRYPTKGRVWHPGGAHPFIGLNEALVHNGDFANYYATCSYLRQRNITPLFLTDTEVSALLFDLWDRVYQYPLEVIIEALAPTTERDFDKLPVEKQPLYRAIQQTHIHASPDGPWFFIIARSQPDEGVNQLLGITDTSMLRPQVFALSETHTTEQTLQIGLIASEKQAIDATLASLHASEPQIPQVADRYWNARGGSHTDGGAFTFTVHRNSREPELIARDKFGTKVTLSEQSGSTPSQTTSSNILPKELDHIVKEIKSGSFDLGKAWQTVRTKIAGYDLKIMDTLFFELVESASTDRALTVVPTLSLLTRLRDWHYAIGEMRKASLMGQIDHQIQTLLASIPTGSDQSFTKIDWKTKLNLKSPGNTNLPMILDVTDFPPEGENSAGRFIADAAEKGWRYFITFGWKGQRFCGCGLGPNSQGVRIDVYGSSGDYLASGLDGAEIVVHGDAQDQVGQIFNAGKLVVHGSVGQTFMYGAKGGEAYIRGNAAGRPLINAVGAPRVVINGTCLDYLAESFMAGDPLNGGGFVILNGISIDDQGDIHDLVEPYPGGNLFSLASGGAIYIRDPYQKLEEDQLNGGHFVPMTNADWDLIEPYLSENESLFDIPISKLLEIDDHPLRPNSIYRKVSAVRLSVLS